MKRLDGLAGRGRGQTEPIETHGEPRIRRQHRLLDPLGHNRITTNTEDPQQRDPDQLMKPEEETGDMAVLIDRIPSLDARSSALTFNLASER